MWNFQTIGFVMKLLPVIVQAVVVVERLAKGSKGKDKQDAALEAVKVAVQTTETITHKDIFNDAEVEAATRSQIDAVVHGMNSVNKAAPAAPTP